jgi:hypothetical protein
VEATQATYGCAILHSGDGEAVVVRGVSVDVGAGEIVVLLVPQGRRRFVSLTVIEHLTMLKNARAKGGWTVERVFGSFPRLAERAGIIVAHNSLAASAACWRSAARS